MNYTLFAILSSVLPILIGIWMVWLEEEKEMAFGIKVTGVILIILGIVWGITSILVYTEIPEYTAPACMNKVGEVPIEYIWNENQNGVYINGKPYLLKEMLHDHTNQIKLISASWSDTTIAAIDTLEVYKYNYKPWMGFVTTHKEQFILVLTHDRWVEAGTCRDRVNELIE